jgi:hypothetical protein
MDWVLRKEDAREFPSLTEAIEWCVSEDLGEISFVLAGADSEIVLDPFDVDENGHPRSQRAHTARVMLDSAILRRQGKLLHGAMNAIYATVKERWKRTLPPFRQQEQADGRVPADYANGKRLIGDDSLSP